MTASMMGSGGHGGHGPGHPNAPAGTDDDAPDTLCTRVPASPGA